MDTIRLTFGTNTRVNFSVCSVQNNYNTKLPIVIEEDGPLSYTVNIFGAEHLDSVFPVFMATKTSFFKFQHNNKLSPCIRLKKNGYISSFLNNNKIYGLEILNKRKQSLFEKYGGHNQKELIVWFGIDEGRDECGIYRTTAQQTETDDCYQTETDSCGSKATIALNNTSAEGYKALYFQEPLLMHKRTFNFCFKKSEKMMDNLYLN
jgi:hypothetical protein